MTTAEASLEAWQRIAEADVRMTRIPTPFMVGRVNCYLVEDEPLTLIDTGPNSQKALGELEHQLAALGRRIEDLELVIITHQHLDHLGLVDLIAERSGAEVAALDVAIDYIESFGGESAEDNDDAAVLMLRHGIAEEIVTALRQVVASFQSWGGNPKVTRPLRDGETLELGNRSLEIRHRPGHSPSDTLFWDAERRLLIAGDHLIKHISSNPLISRPLDGSGGRTRALVDYLNSMKSTRELPAEIVVAGHGEPIEDHVALIDSRLAMHQRRAEKIYGLIAEQSRTGHEIAQAIWGNVAVTQAFLTLSEVIGHVDLLEDAGLVREAEDDDVIRYEITSDAAVEEIGDLIPGGNPALARG
jgi:glyoxylase-like metal-dependent hydrolase (beta-lactamase superfamily II)